MSMRREVRTGATFAGIGLVLLVGAGLVARNGRVGGVERSVFHAINGLPDWLYRPLWIFQQLGNIVVALLVGLLLAALLRRPTLAAATVVAVGAKLWLEQVVKSVVERSRPGTSIGDAILRGQVSAGGLSFVSGHAVITVASATALTAVITDRRWRVLIWVLVFLNGFTRIYVGAHNPLDIVGGAGLGLVIGGPLYAWLATPDRSAAELQVRSITVLTRAFSNRHPGDVLRLAIGISVLLTTAMFVHHDHVGTVETNVFRLVNDFPLPTWSYPVVWLVMQFGNIASVPAAAATAGIARRWRLALDFAVAGGTIYLLAKVVKAMVERGRPQTLLDSVHILGEPARGLGYVSGHSAVAIALATVAAPYLGRRARRWVWAAAVSVCVFRVYVGAHLPLDVVGGIALGWAAGAAAHLILGAPEGHVSLRRLRRALTHLGFAAVDVQPVSLPTRRSASFRVVTEAGAVLFVKVAARERRDDDLLYRAWRVIRRRWIGHSHTRSARSEVEHEACMGAMAAAAGVPTPAVVFAGVMGNGAGILVQQWVDAVPIDQVAVDDPLRREVIHQLDLLHTAGIAHGDVHAGSILVDGSMQPWLVDFSRAEAGAGQAARAEDSADLRAMLASLPAPRIAVSI